MPCYGNDTDHCCYVAGKRCPHSVDNIIDDSGKSRRWGCGLRAELGNWDAVLADPRYLADVAPSFRPLGMNCRDWPESAPSHNCAACSGDGE